MLFDAPDASGSDDYSPSHLEKHGWYMAISPEGEAQKLGDDPWPETFYQDLDLVRLNELEDAYGKRPDEWWCRHNEAERAMLESRRALERLDPHFNLQGEWASHPVAGLFAIDVTDENRQVIMEERAKVPAEDAVFYTSLVEKQRRVEEVRVRLESARKAREAHESAQALAKEAAVRAKALRRKLVQSEYRKAIPAPAKMPDVFQDPPKRATPRPIITTPVPGPSRTLPTKRLATPLALVDSQTAAKKRKKESGSAKKINTAVDEWKSKYTKAFPQFVFHFEYDADSSSRAKAVKATIDRLGGRIDQFFSKKVTHLVTLRPVSKGAPLANKDLNHDGTRKTMQPPKVKGGKILPHSPNKNPFIETGATAEVSDLVGKATLMGIKVWHLNKLHDVVSLLCPAEEAAPIRDELSQLLEDERLHGTRERDSHAPRHDYYYFSKGNQYLLIEDALGVHRPIMAKEYERTATRADALWPIMYTDFLRISESVRALDDGTPPELLREKAWRMYVSREGWNGEVAPLPESNLRRSTSAQALNRRSSGRISFGEALPTPPPYQAASGNSVALTSNINSTCNSRMSLESGLGALAQQKDKRIMQMSKRVQVLKGNASARFAAGISKKTRLGAANGLEGADDDLEIIDRPRASLPMEIKPDRRFKSQKEVIELLKLSRRPNPIPSDVTKAQRRAVHDKAWDGSVTLLGDKAGYCENCRVKFDNLESHGFSKRHLRFAQNPASWESLDLVLDRLERLRKASPIDFSQYSNDYEGEQGTVEESERVTPADEPGQWW